MLRTRIQGWLLLAVGLISAIGLHLVAHGRTPIFDGIPLPPPPYRYVSPPPDLISGNQQPLGADDVITIQDAATKGASVLTQDGQVAAFFAPGALAAEPGSLSIEIHIEPVRQPPLAPNGSSLRGNVYRISAIQQPGGIPAQLVKPFRVVLQVPRGPFDEVEWFDGTSWHHLQTNFESDQFPTAVVPAMGEVAGVARKGSTSTATRPLAFSTLLFAGLIGVLVLVGATGAFVLALRKDSSNPARGRR